MAADNKQSDFPAMQGRDNVADAGRQIFLQQLRRMQLYEAGSRTGEDIESVHKMRVAVRRMRSLLRFLDGYYPDRTVASAETRLRQIARALGAIRDLDVLILDLQQFSATLPLESQQHANALISRLDRRRARRRKRLNAFLDSKRYRRGLRLLEKFAGIQGKRAGRPLLPHAPQELRHVLPSLLHQRLAIVSAYDAVLPAADDKRLHALRVECKRLRYAIEFFAPVLGASAASFLELITAMQDTLGRINDIAVFVSRLQKEKLSPEQASIVEAYSANRMDELISLRATFYEEWTRLNTRAQRRCFSDALLVLR